MDIQKIVNECKERGTVRVKFNCPKPLDLKLDLGDRRLKKYDLYYCDEDGNEIQ